MDQQFKETIDYKAKKIGKAMDAKEKSMAIMAAGRDATLTVMELMRIARIDDETKDEWRNSEEGVKKKLKEWRNWFYYEIYTRDPDDDLLQEAKEKGEIDPLITDKF